MLGVQREQDLFSQEPLVSESLLAMPVYFFFFFPSRYFQPGFYLRSVCPQPYHFKWVSLQIDVNGAILDMKALLYLLSLVTAIANLSTDGVYLSSAKSIYWHN